MTRLSQPERRASERYGFALPITLEDDEEVRTHDVSAGGLLFEAEAPRPVGSPLALALRYRAGGRACRLEVQGRVVRVERHGDNYNVAVELYQPLFA